MNPYLHYTLLLCLCTIVYVPTALYIGKNSIIKKIAVAVAMPTCIVAFTAFAFALTNNYYLFIPALLSLFSTFVILTYFVKKPFVKLDQALQLLTDGQLTNIDISKLAKENTEVGNIARSLDNMSSKLNEIVSGMQTVSNELLTHSNIILNSSQILADGTSIQAASTEEVSSSIEEVVSILDQTNTNATEARNISNNAAKGIEVNFNQSVETSNSIRNIYENIDKIDEISTATKILSLNASVEAARAGEHGKGFAVVATEVQKLANSSTVFSSAINELASAALTTAETATKSLELMAPEVRTTANLVNEISTGAMEQRQAINQISESIQELNQSTQNTSANSQEMAASAHQLKEEASKLNKLITFFKV